MGKSFRTNRSETSGKTIIFRIDYLGQLGEGYSPRVSRKIVLKETQSLDDLNDAIIYQSFKWNDPHMYSFYFDNKPFSQNREMEYTCNPEEDMGLNEKMPHSTETGLSDLRLKSKQKFLHIFDFGDEHHFGITVEGFGIIEKGKRYPLIVEKKGEAPEQYPQEEEEE